MGGFFRHDRRTALKFGTHVRIKTLTLTFFWTHPTPGGFRGLYIVKNLSRRTAPKFGTHVRIDTLTLTNKKFDPPHPRGVYGVIYCLKSFAPNVIILTRDESPLVYRALVVSEDSNFDLSAALFHVQAVRTESRYRRQFGSNSSLFTAFKTV